MIPKTIHMVWVGDDSKRPDSCIKTWVDLNPTWNIKIWGNEEFKSYHWKNRKHLDDMFTKGDLGCGTHLCGVADIMRYEILFNEGGFAMDADAVCVRSLEDWLLEPVAFTCWENEIYRQGLLAVGYMASVKGNEFMGAIVNDIYNSPTVIDKRAWQAVGPVRLTQNWLKLRYRDLTIYPSHFFLPEHYCGSKYTGSGPVFCRQKWYATHNAYK